MGITPETAKKMIDRCHRGGDRQYYRREKKTRAIFVEMNRWVDCESIATSFRTPETRASCDYKYGPSTTKRRNLALKKRREVVVKGEVTKPYVKFPAILMGLKPGAKKYVQIANFSNVPIDIVEEKKEQTKRS